MAMTTTMTTMRMPRLHLRLVLFPALALALAGCPGDDPDPGGVDASAEVTEDVADVVEVEDDALDVVEDTLEADDVDTGPIRPEPGELVAGTAALDSEYVFKGVWAGEPGTIVAVGNDGIVASRDPDGRWSVLTRAEGAEVLNAVHGVDGDALWAVGVRGTTLPGTRSSFGESGGCVTSAECEDGDPCTLSLCTAEGTCAVQPSGLAGCCGSTVASWSFSGGAMSPWTSVDEIGGMGWSVVSRRSVSEGWSLYFGDPTKEPPNYDNGMQVAATAVSPTVTLPNSGTATVSFYVWMETEPDPSYDTLNLEVQLGGTRTQVWSKAELPIVPTGSFVPVEVDLTPWRGQSVSLRFRFDSVDGALNNFEGAYVDDVVIDTACAPGGAASSQTGPTLWGVFAASATAAWAVGQAGTIIQYDGASWSTAQGSDTSAVWNGITGSDTSIAMVGNAGKVSVSLGGGLQNISTGTTHNLHAAHTADGHVFWAVGDSGRIFRGEGASWASLPSPTPVSLRDVYAVSNSDVWVVGFLGTVAHFDGQMWSLIPIPTDRDLFAVWVDDAGLVTLAGRDGVILQGGLDGFTEVAQLHPGGELNALWGTGSALVAVGSGGRIFATQGGAWTDQTSSTSQTLLAVFGFAEDDVWAVGRSGTALRYDGTSWERVEVPLGASLNALWGRSPSALYAAGSGGALLLWNGAAWTELVSTTTRNLRAVYGLSESDVWAVGAGGTIMHYGGIGWARSPITPLPTQDGLGEEIVDELHAVWAAAADDAWAVGANGRIVRWDGVAWTNVDTDFGVTLRGIYGLAPDDIWAVGNHGHAIHWNGETWQPMETGSVATLHHIHGDGEGHVVVVGTLGTVLTLVR